MTENELIRELKILFSEYELDLPYTHSLEIVKQSIKSIEELKQYHSIGTLHECKMYADKHESKKPILFTGTTYICPDCRRSIQQTELLDVYCKYCGQAIDWREI